MATSKAAICSEKYTGGYDEARHPVDHERNASWLLSYIQLSRLNPPISWFLVFLPEIFGVLHAAAALRSPGRDVLCVAAVILVHSFFISNAGVAWNDLVDADIDAKVERTKNRPIARGAISRTAAFVFVCSQVAFAGICLMPVPRAAVVAMGPIVVSTGYYPFAKRHIPAPQLVIAFCMSWAVMFGRLAMGRDDDRGHWMNYKPVVYLMAATAVWTVLCDTVYAHQDLADDCKVGVRSLAVLVQGYAKCSLWLLLVAMVMLLYYSGAHDGVAYHVFSVGGCAVYTATMLALVDLKDPVSCGKWAGSSFGFIGFLIASGLLAQYLAT
ncbi:4-hydroxybenzoate polyprenyltransferase [Penicillium subrubescens]|jgi:4-hydroxybenzoate polyprenyltransferase|uniref:4-hydroxybenzoate polyprenyltransferase, mitochondrial n=1 Tax=Penicillium subrubescens TaxID=1316194 RepID=A0A1Q5TUB8_9EURO|nr:4-hydroxybenzoate polyprenyltransferase [Penicillium subrubescens]KAJ5911097.1 4-hydroxybenzoate polyprenyltransferase [Penicillium subrubescens]OKP03790.1 4-hydroxybenzoate polyprenyltransferase, mitochondrial [Penicillium subrubescens]